MGIEFQVRANTGGGTGKRGRGSAERVASRDGATTPHRHPLSFPPPRKKKRAQKRKEKNQELGTRKKPQRILYSCLRLALHTAPSSSYSIAMSRSRGLDALGAHVNVPRTVSPRLTTSTSSR